MGLPDAAMEIMESIYDGKSVMILYAAIDKYGTPFFFSHIKRVGKQKAVIYALIRSLKSACH
ncbi:hypothetical protein SLEP1_g49043 [Rubroshorea leprosula]|uniref:Transposase n=1 Tax=Rubroshorea leprosula TaxID=152421 RepID=A0AAV5LVI4_9ROSI|nr:hypothetical protein SLEP1_g49043 [Rubroshorea leprosula]